MNGKPTNLSKIILFFLKVLGIMDLMKLKELHTVRVGY